MKSESIEKTVAEYVPEAMTFFWGNFLEVVHLAGPLSDLAGGPEYIRTRARWLCSIIEPVTLCRLWYARTIDVQLDESSVYR